jgi:UDP-N-acetylmuramoyl-L-alanyl-D-glutamate--2,6-diaminopimelate ligase
MKLQELLKNIKPIQIIGDVETEITGVNIDSRKIKDGHLFIAMKGTQTDGHSYIGKAIGLGAKAILLEDMPEERQKDVTYIQVASTEDAVGKVANNLPWRSITSSYTGRRNGDKWQDNNRHLII